MMETHSWKGSAPPHDRHELTPLPLPSATERERFYRNVEVRQGACWDVAGYGQPRLTVGGVHAAGSISAPVAGDGLWQTAVASTALDAMSKTALLGV